MVLKKNTDLDISMQQYLDDELVKLALKKNAIEQVTTSLKENVVSVIHSETVKTPSMNITSAKYHMPHNNTIIKSIPVIFCEEIATLACTVFKIPIERLDVKENMSSYGIDSIIVTELMKCISNLLHLPIAPTVFFEARNLKELAFILYKRYQKQIDQYYQKTIEKISGIEKKIITTKHSSSITNDVEEAITWINKFQSLKKEIVPVNTTTTQKKSLLKISEIEQSYEPIAIIAMEGIFSNSANLEEFEQHLHQGNDCITEIPIERWNWREVFGEPQKGEFTRVKYGGFAPDIDKFDSMFFGMSPREAALMDPQHRLFIQIVWRLIESAGYNPKSLSGQKIGIFLGINLQDYANLIDKVSAMEAMHLTSLGHMFCPNRLSFFLDIHGPSEVIDTACSSSLVAIHRAVLSIQHENCKMAIAGGSNLLISPDMHIMYSKIGMICEDGRCKTFSNQANGYARADGVGAILLKSLKQAEKDNDTILCIIRGSAENHGGMSTSLTAPNPKAQASLIVEAHNKADIDPRSIRYIECHGTGTALGDPIEINGLKIAFEQLYKNAKLASPEYPYCGLGSVKSNIGHTETAAGVAGLIKTVLSIRNKTLYKSLHCTNINPMIELEKSPFFILQEARPWEKTVIDGVELPRCAGVSSFGAGGSNAHVIIQEYIEPSLTPPKSVPSLILLSAKNKLCLEESVIQLLRALKNNLTETALIDIAYTLQIGREAMQERLALIVNSIDELKDKLNIFIHNKKDNNNQIINCWYGNTKYNKDVLQITNYNKNHITFQKNFFYDDLQKLAQLWITGINIDWQKLYDKNLSQKDRYPRRVNLPTYPFIKQRHWFTSKNKNSDHSVSERRKLETEKQNQLYSQKLLSSHFLHPLVQQNTSNITENRFTSIFHGEESFFQDHKISGKKILPGVAYLEIARAAIKQIHLPEDSKTIMILHLKNVVWIQPFIVYDQPIMLHISLTQEKDKKIAYRIYNTDIKNNEQILYNQGTAFFAQSKLQKTLSQKIDINILRDTITNGCPDTYQLKGRHCYEAFKAMSIDYGPSHQCLKSLYFSAPERPIEVLAEIMLPINEQKHSKNYVLHTGLIDSGLQACIGLIIGTDYNVSLQNNITISHTSLPFTLDEFIFITPSKLPEHMWVWIRYMDIKKQDNKLQKLNIDFFDTNGRACIRMIGFLPKTIKTKKLISTEENTLLMFRPIWLNDPSDLNKKISWAQHFIILCSIDNDDTLVLLKKEIDCYLPEATFIHLSLSKTIQASYIDIAVKIFNIIKQAILNQDTGKIFLQLIIKYENDTILLTGLSGLLKTVSLENARFFGQLITYDINNTVQLLVKNLLVDSDKPRQTQIRYKNSIRQVLHWQEYTPSINLLQQIPWKNNGVYLITGGTGGLGLIFARQIIHYVHNANIFLCGRSEFNSNIKTRIVQILQSSKMIHYRKVDITIEIDVIKLINDITDEYGRIDGILHCAGLLKDNFIQKKTADEFYQVMAPKVFGAIHLDNATAHIDLDFMLLFSSAAGALGSVGQADYSTANAFLDIFSKYRNKLVQYKKRQGKTISINWPLWLHGGMRMETSAETMMQQNSGMFALPSEKGILAFDQIMSCDIEQIMVLYGIQSRVRHVITTSNINNNVKEKSIKSVSSCIEETTVIAKELHSKIEKLLLQQVSQLMKFDLKDLDVAVQLSDYGFDSISFTDFANKLNQQYQLELTPTIFFEYPTISTLASWLSLTYTKIFIKITGIQKHAPITNLTTTPLLSQSKFVDIVNTPESIATQKKLSIPNDLHIKKLSNVHKKNDDLIAIIGMSGTFPMAVDLDAFWNNLITGRDCISEIPADRWDWRAYYGDPTIEKNKTNVKWGGFIDDIGNFDAKFFGISVHEAELMDPQQRLLMQYVWKVIEDAGYSAASLSGSNTGIFIATASSGYSEIAIKNSMIIDSYSSTSVVSSIGPNRMSYFLNLHGPSEPIETACSSSLVAVHRALTAITCGDCDQAIVGGINLIINPETQISFNQAGMLCEDGRCKTFSSRANGYVRGEGVGMLMLKKLKIAENDGDHIYAVILSSAENHGGRSNSLTAPNPKAQTELIKTAYNRAQIDPRTISYIEAHGTGTALGDPIEINSLKSAFKDMYKANGCFSEITTTHCAIGSVKTNIGHLELASGIAGLIKVLLQLKNKTLVKSLHCNEINPYIHLNDSPFYLLNKNSAWNNLKDALGQNLPRRAGISSFGFGGVNAHIIIEEYVSEKSKLKRKMMSSNQTMIILSAKNRERLQVSAKNLLAFVSKHTSKNSVSEVEKHQYTKNFLSDVLCKQVSDVLQIDTNEIEITKSLKDYGIDQLHRTILKTKLQEIYNVEFSADIFLKNDNIITIVTEILETKPNFYEYIAPEFKTKNAAVNAKVESIIVNKNLESQPSLTEIAYTLQVGREAMDERLAMLVNSYEELIEKLNAFITEKTIGINNIYSGQAKLHKNTLSAFVDDNDIEELINKWIQRGKLSKLLEVWSMGLQIDWKKLYQTSFLTQEVVRPKRISMPGYPFLPQKHWIIKKIQDSVISNTPCSKNISLHSTLHPLVHENISTSQQCGFKSTFTGKEFFLTDHTIQNNKVLPGVVFIEMARAAAAIWYNLPIQTITLIRDIVWISPFIVKNTATLQILLSTKDKETIFYISSDNANSNKFAVVEKNLHLHSQGRISFETTTSTPRAHIDPTIILTKNNMQSIDVNSCYSFFLTQGIEYGQTHRVMKELYSNNDQVLSKLELPNTILTTLHQFILHPALMDGALQASIGIDFIKNNANTNNNKSKLILPFAIDTISIFNACTASMWIYIRRTESYQSHNNKLQKLDIDLYNENGLACILIRGFTARLKNTEISHSGSSSHNIISKIPTVKPLITTQALSENISTKKIYFEELKKNTINYFRQLLAKILKQPIEEITADETFDNYGIDSIMIIKLTRELENTFGTLPKTLFFEYQTISEITDHFLTVYQSQLISLIKFNHPQVTTVSNISEISLPISEKTFKKKVMESVDTVAAISIPKTKKIQTTFPITSIITTSPLDIAIIGLSVRYPLADNFDIFWNNLREGKNCITEIPSERWNWKLYYNQNHLEKNEHFCKWGGFINGIDEFDPLFFNIAPNTAAFMDPQERLFLQHAWSAMEDAGYCRESLYKYTSIHNENIPGQVGVYAGVMYSEYQLLCMEANRRKNSGFTMANFFASIANRVSYTLNLHGPSMTVDTMCSSSLTAIHLACQDLHSGRIDMAFAGGVNVSVHPNKYSVLSQGKFISSTGMCKSFGHGGDGYVPSEGVGVVLLKRLIDAEQDKDHIYGVIKSSALNHGGKTNSFSVPNPNAQYHVIGRALVESHVDPRAITYIEAHGTGTNLGDPIEIAGLTKAFSKYAKTNQHCWIGSVKSNIGHAESAAGIASLTKVLLQMREGQIAPSLHSKKLNPNIEFSTTPFEVNHHLRVWPRPIIDGKTHNRVAGISSFGAGGSNAHLIVQEYFIPPIIEYTKNQIIQTQLAFVLSAKTKKQLHEYVTILLAYIIHINQSSQINKLTLEDVAYTLQVGREAMPYRLGLSANSFNTLISKLNSFVCGNCHELHLGYVKTINKNLEHSTLNMSIENLLSIWANGANIDWQKRHINSNSKAVRISLPTYPFAREHYWLTDIMSNANNTKQNLDDNNNLTPPQIGMLILHPKWTSIPPLTTTVNLTDEIIYKERWIIFSKVAINITGANCITLNTNGINISQKFTTQAIHIFSLIKNILLQKPTHRILLQLVINGEELFTVALLAMLKTAQMENPLFTGQIIELEKDSTKNRQEICLLQELGTKPKEQYIRYRQGQREVMHWVEYKSHTSQITIPWKNRGIYLITGGTGGLGLIFAAEIIRHVNEVHLILTGRSSFNETHKNAISVLQKSNSMAKIEYVSVDVTDEIAVFSLIDQIQKKAESKQHLNGIIHGAGIFFDNFIIKKDTKELCQVMEAKVNGTINLDLASRGIILDFFIMLSSLAGATGNLGQSDYATANAFMDVYATYRNQNPAAHGRTLSINWPLWEDGSMDINIYNKKLMLENTGLIPMQTKTGIQALYIAIHSSFDQVIVLEGNITKLHSLFLNKQQNVVLSNKNNNIIIKNKNITHEEIEELIINLLCDMLNLPRYRLEKDIPIEQYGVDSIVIMKLTTELEKTFGALPKTLFFEYPSVRLVSTYLTQNFLKKVTIFPSKKITKTSENFTSTNTKKITPEIVSTPITTTISTISETKKDDIAIIGMSGRFPQSPNIDVFWKNLSQGQDLITEIPMQRWDHNIYFDANKNISGKSYCKWGGFLDDIDKFDPLFFKISPAEAELLDPQEKLFLETVWNLMESTGYQGETLERICQKQVGVFVGAMSQQYHAFKSDLVRESLIAMSSHSSIANRISYFFNFQGPSIAIDTMCSSALVAIHMACESLLKNECKVAIAGAVNLSIHPKKYVALSAVQMLGSHLYSTSFGQGDGYLPSEAVGAILLKPLNTAIVDKDDILGVLKSTAINHNGQSNGYYVPSLSSQMNLITHNFSKAKINPRTISYVESAANGSAIGDIIELNALTMSFAKHTADLQFCSIGSVKSNMGHAEAASGISQLIKVLLQLKYRQLVPSIKAEPLNSDINFNITPFHLQKVLEPWTRPILTINDGKKQEFPLRATVSSFGAGGSNAHLIIEEYINFSNTTLANTKHKETSELILLSARTASQLLAVVGQLLVFIKTNSTIPLKNLAYTLQTSREFMDYKLALIVKNIEELRVNLNNVTKQTLFKSTIINVFSSTPEQDNTIIRSLLSGPSGKEMLKTTLIEKDLNKLALYWINGVKIQWHIMYSNTLSDDNIPCRITTLPTYPFTKESYWLNSNFFLNTENSNIEFTKKSTSIIRNHSLLNDIQHYLSQELENMLNIPMIDINIKKSFLDYGVDSIIAIKLRRNIEKKFQIKITARDLAIHTNLDALISYIATRLQNKTTTTKALIKASTEKKTTQKIKPEIRQPVSEGQKGLWLLHQITTDISAYNVPIALRFKKRLHITLLRQAYIYVLKKHSVLRSVFKLYNDHVYCLQQENIKEFFVQENIIDLLLKNQQDIINALRERSKIPFNLESGPLCRIHILSGIEENYILLTVHHIVFDGSSAIILIHDLLKTYSLLVAGTPPQLEYNTINYVDFVTWQQKFMSSIQGQTQLQYWKTKLSGEIPQVTLPSDYTRPILPCFSGNSIESILPEILSTQLKELAKSLNINLSTLFIGVLKILLQRYSGENDISVGMPISGRSKERFENIVGYFVNMLVIRHYINEKELASHFLYDLQMTIVDAIDNSDYPFPALLKILNAERKLEETNKSSVFQVIFAYQNFSASNIIASQETTLSPQIQEFETVDGVHQEGTHDFSVEIYEKNNIFYLRMDYRTDLFIIKTIQRVMDHYINLLTALISNPHIQIAKLTMLSSSELKLITEKWSSSPKIQTQQSTVVELFQHQASHMPDKIALLLEEKSLSYQELDLQSSCLATYLKKQGIKPFELIGVCLNRSIEMIVCLFGIFKANAVYVPIASEYPSQRIGYLCHNSGIKLLLTTKKLRDNVIKKAIKTIIPSDTSAVTWRYLAIDILWSSIISMHPVFFPPPQLTSSAYIIYTSGSTGKPRGVIISHSAISHHCQVIMNTYKLTEQDRILQFSSMSVDTSLEQILPGLLCGATIIVRAEDIWTPKTFAIKLSTLKISIIDLSPSYFNELLLDAHRTTYWTNFPSLRIIILGGEILTPDIIALWQNSLLRKYRLFNAYGPTETTITSTLIEILPKKLIASSETYGTSIGRPLSGEFIYILDSAGRTVPVGVPGELCIGGAGLAIGYLNQPEQTTEKFIYHPIFTQTKIYRTGDCARWFHDSNIIFMGRLDDQVKIRGFRVECSEVEAALLTLNIIHQAVVLPKLLDKTIQLIAFIVLNHQNNQYQTLQWQNTLRQALMVMIPEYMIPSIFVLIEKIPLMSNGKVNRNVLYQYQLKDEITHKQEKPKNTFEIKLSKIWAEVLNNNNIGIYDNFFDLGGHSLLSLRLISIIQQTFNIDLPLSSFFQAPNISSQALLLKQYQQKLKNLSPLICCLQPIGILSPWFYMHALAGNTLCYRELSIHMGQQRQFYALQAPDLLNADEHNNHTKYQHPGSIEELANLYITAIREIQPKGPYYLGGWSMGGLIAYEIAQQLINIGEKVATLVLIESYTPDKIMMYEKLFLKNNKLSSDNNDNEENRVRILLLTLAKELKLTENDIIFSAIRKTSNILNIKDRLNQFFEKINQKEKLLKNISIAQLQNLFLMLQKNAAIITNYKPRAYNGKVLQIYAGINLNSNDNSWTELLTGSIEKIKINNVDHYSIINLPHVKLLAATLNNYLENNKI